MTAIRKNVEFAKRILADRIGNPYVYGGTWSATNLKQGCDCSALVADMLGAVTKGAEMIWGRESEGATTESYRYVGGPGSRGPFGTIRVASPQDIPADAAVKIALHHGPGGGANSHMWCEVDGVRGESAGSKGCVTGPQARAITDSYAGDWFYLPGPIAEDGTEVTTIEPPDTLYADVSEWQVPVDDSYPYRVLCIRSNDGTYRDKDWAANYAWCKRAADDGRLAFFIVYFVWRPNWQAAVDTLKSQIGAPHPKMAVMLDVESWSGQIGGNQSGGINAAFAQIATWLGDARRVIGYGNKGDLDNLWPSKPPGTRLVVAGYGNNIAYPGKIAHQYTNGEGYGAQSGLPDGAAPFGKCDMNSADGLTATAFAAACGITTASPTPTGGISMADAQSIINQVAGIDANGAPLPWRKVRARGNRNIGDVVNDPTRGPWESDHNGKHYDGTFDADEQLVTVAEQIAWTHKFSDGVVRDAGDVLIGLGEFLVKQGAFKS